MLKKNHNARLDHIDRVMLHIILELYYSLRKNWDLFDSSKYYQRFYIK